MCYIYRGKYDTYKGSTRSRKIYQVTMNGGIGKYDTYKGSTQVRRLFVNNHRCSGNMILIKDRH